jgi:2'-5' RNA ligase
VGERWHAFLAALPVGRGTRASTLIVPVPAAKPALEVSSALDDAGAGDLPPHITLLYPFLPTRVIDHAAESAVAEIASAFTTFRFSLVRVASFPGVLYLEPRPDGPFLELTEAYRSRWPEFPPYGGAFDEVIPHLTVTTGSQPPGLASRLAGLLPIEATASEVWLVGQERDGRWSTRKRCSLGGMASSRPT